VVLGTELKDDGIADSSSDFCWGVGELSVSTNKNMVLLRREGMSRRRRCLVGGIHCIMIGNRRGRSPMAPRGRGVCGCWWGNSSSSVASDGQVPERLEGLRIVVCGRIDGKHHSLTTVCSLSTVEPKRCTVIIGNVELLNGKRVCFRCNRDTGPMLVYLVAEGDRRRHTSLS
jgi:hypothetical protein